MDFTVSIHCNASGNESAGGCWLIFRDGLPNSSALAWNIENEFVRQCPSLSPPAPKVLGAIKASGKRLTMVYGPKPTHGAVLIECAFLTNDNDRALLQKKSVQRGIAKAIVYGAEGRFREINGK
jgi:N-acetylmuramoyl-L-alanine amidase